VQYNFERNDDYKVEVYNIDDMSQINNPAALDSLGYLQFTLHEIVTSADQLMKKPLICRSKPSHRSFITIEAEQV